VSGTRLLVGLAWAFALVELPLALSAPTGLLVVPAYALLCLVVAAGAAVDAFGGRPARCGAWGFGHLLATIALVTALDVGGRVQGGTWGQWGVPFAFVLVVGWLPPVVAFGGAMLAVDRGRRRARRVVRRRRAEEPPLPSP
jgi:hypothetical protein